ncbi:MAG TPA: glycosyltransferase family 2 protein [Flavisolibacter sp.]|nr:glycosyltransferase family 2 protein [Flavisolibacter sp.]
MQTPTISVVIPVKNGAPWLDDCIRGIMRQSLFRQTEIIAIDSGSTDNSLKILQKYPVRVYSISPSEFNHGLTRQYGVELSSGKYVVMTVQDAHAVDEFWLEHLLNGFTADSKVAAVCGSQVVQKGRDKNPVEWFRPISQPTKVVYKYASAEDFQKLTPLEKMWACGWDNVTAMYKRSILKEIPFQNANFGEDAIWAKDALLSGYTLVYNQAAKVYHFHYEDLDYSFRRNFAVMYMRYKQFGCIYNRPLQTLRQHLSTIKVIALSNPLTLKEKWKWLQYNKMQFKGRVKAYEIFAAALAESEDRLDAAHEHYCGKPPVHQLAQSGDHNLPAKQKID